MKFIIAILSIFVMLLSGCAFTIEDLPRLRHKREILASIMETQPHRKREMEKKIGQLDRIIAPLEKQEKEWMEFWDSLSPDEKLQWMMHREKMDLERRKFFARLFQSNNNNLKEASRMMGTTAGHIRRQRERGSFGDGFREGYRFANPTGFIPFPPIPEFGRDTYNDGFVRGWLEGQK